MIGLIGRDGGLSTLCHSCGFACQHRVLKTFPGPGYLHSEDGIVWLWHSLVNLYIWLTISSCYGSIPLALGLIGRDGSLSNLCHSCGFARQQWVLKMFPGPGYIFNIYIYIKESFIPPGGLRIFVWWKQFSFICSFFFFFWKTLWALKSVSVSRNERFSWNIVSTTRKKKLSLAGVSEKSRKNWFPLARKE